MRPVRLVGLGRLVRVVTVATAAAMVAIVGAARPASAEVSPREAEVVVAAEGAEGDALESVLRELLGRLPVRVTYGRAASVDPRDVVTPHAGARPLVARVWVDAAAGGDGGTGTAPEPPGAPRRVPRATIYIVDGAWERVLVRHVERGGAADEVAREKLAHIVEASVDALLAGATIGVTRAEATAALGIELPPPDPPRTKRSKTPRVALGVGYDVALWGASETGGALAVGSGPTANVFAVPAGSRFGVLTSAQLRFPVSEERERVGVRLESAAASVRGVAALANGPFGVLRAQLGVGIERVRIEPRRADAAIGSAGAGSARDPGAVTLEPARAVWTPLVQAAATWSFPFGAGAELMCAAGVDVPVVTRRYFADRGGEEVVLLEGYAVRPAVSVAVFADLIGAREENEKKQTSR